MYLLLVLALVGCGAGDALLDGGSEAAAASSTQLQGPAYVIDGDTLEVQGQRLRLFGIDAPELEQLCRRPNGLPWPCGRRARAALAERLMRDRVICETGERDRYDRLTARCMHYGIELNDWMVRNGWAIAYRRYSDAYVAAEDEAKSKGVGIWDGKFQAPEAWRIEHR